MPKNENKKHPKEEEEEVESEEESEHEEIDLSELPKNIFRCVKAVRKMHAEEFEAIDEEYEKERLALEKKYEEKKQAFYAKRNPIITGKVDVPKVEGEEEEGTEETEDKGIPNFWLTVLSSHPSIGKCITEEDVPALEALTNVTVAYDEDYTSFTLTFHFAENDFFTNKTLTKRYVVSPNLLDDKNPSLSEVKGDAIDWKPSKNLCVTEVKKKQKAKSGRNKGQVRTITSTEPKASFFHYFDEHDDAEEDEEEEDEDEEEDRMGKKKFYAEEDYDIGHTIRTMLIPEAILWFTGEAHMDDDYMYGSDEDDEEEDEDEEEEDDEDEDAKNKKTKGKKPAATGFAAAPGAPGQQQPECKQN